MSKLQDAKKNVIVAEALRLFLEQSVEDVTIAQIAKAVGVGEATVYRYFGKKQSLVVCAAAQLWEEVSRELLPKETAENGFEDIRQLYTAFLTVYQTRREFYAFVYDFDAYILSEQPSDTGEYEDKIQSLKGYFDAAYRRGVADGSVRALADSDLFYFTTTHALLTLCKKLSVEGELIRQDKALDKAAEISELINIFLYTLKQ